MNSIKIEEILQSFYEISGMDVAIVNSRNRIIARRYSGALYCSTVHKSQKCLETCVESDRCGLCAAYEKGGLYVYKCPFGIYEALMPIYKNDVIVAYIFVGMGIEDTPENERELMDSALDLSPTLNKKALEKSIAEVPRYSKKKLDAFAALLPLLSEYIEANNLLSDTDMTVGQLVKTYVKNNLSKKITLSDLSWKLHCSTVTLTEHFKKEYGITIMEYVMQKRMDKAERLLEHSDLSIREISEECGFPDIEYFSRCFKGIHNMSPTAWRKAHTNTAYSQEKSEARNVTKKKETEKEKKAAQNRKYSLEESDVDCGGNTVNHDSEIVKAAEEDSSDVVEDKVDPVSEELKKYGSCFG